MREELLIERGSDCGKKDGVIVVLKSLRALGEPGMHGVAGFMGERVNVGKYIAFVIHEDVGRGAETAGGERAAAFALGFVAIAPASAEAFCEGRRVFFSERRKRGE